jgi:hypothetical protein
VTENGRKSQNKKLYNFYSQNIFQVIKSRRMKQAGHVACITKNRHTKFWSGNLKERYHVRDLGLGGKISKWILINRMGWHIPD